MTVKEILINARDLIISEENWIQGYFAKNTKGKVVEPKAADACQWCAMGAIFATTPEDIDPSYVINKLFKEMEYPGRFNDNATHAEVIAAFDKTIETLEWEGNDY